MSKNIEKKDDDTYCTYDDVLFNKKFIMWTRILAREDYGNKEILTDKQVDKLLNTAWDRATSDKRDEKLVDKELEKPKPVWCINYQIDEKFKGAILKKFMEANPHVSRDFALGFLKFHLF